jgi:hypothetical protein
MASKSIVAMRTSREETIMKECLTQIAPIRQTITFMEVNIVMEEVAMAIVEPERIIQGFTCVQIVPKGEMAE